jgi:hypothetical protein
MWNNRDVPPATLTTITYGGTNKPKDTTVAGFPASVQAGQIGIPIVGTGVLLMMEYLLPAETAEIVRSANDYYSGFLAIPPYFAATLPSMPVYSYYSRFMGPDAIPIQFVKVFSDRHHHIPEIFTDIGLHDDSGDLAALYTKAAELGFTAGSGEEPPADEGEEKPGKPPKEESESEDEPPSPYTSILHDFVYPLPEEKSSNPDMP